MTNKIPLKIASIVIGIIIFGVLLFVAFRIIGTQASDSEPRDVVVSNIEKNSVKLSWATGSDTQAVVEYGTSPTALNFFAPESAKEKNHTLDLTLLSPGTTYYFSIRIGDKKYDNGGVPWTFTTKNAEDSIASPPTTTPNPTSGSVSPTAIQSLHIDDNASTCDETNCDAIKAKLGKGCSTQDYMLCLRNLTPTTTVP